MKPQNPNHVLKTAIQYKGDTDPNTSGNQPGKWAERVLTSDNRAITLPPATVPWPNSGGLTLSGDYVWVRFVYDDAAKTVTTWSSTNGTTFTSFGAPISVTEYLSGAGGLRVGVFGKHDGSGDDNVHVRRVQRRELVRPADGGRQLRRQRLLPAVGPVRRLRRSTRSGRSSTRSAANPPTVGGGHLTMPMLRGDLYTIDGDGPDARCRTCPRARGSRPRRSSTRPSTRTARRPGWR